MHFIPNDPPREFDVGHSNQIALKDCGRMELAPNEQISFVTDSGTEYDVARKSWGYYATPSTNGRLSSMGLRAALMSNETGHLYIVLVEGGCEDDFASYLDNEQQTLLAWLDTDEAVHRVRSLLKNQCQNDPIQ